MLNLIQATINQNNSLLGCITKKDSEKPSAESTEKPSAESLEKPSAESSEAAESKNDDQEEHESCSDSGVYQAFLVEFTTEEGKIHTLETENSKQVRIQFLYREKTQKNVDKFLLLVHEERKYIKDQCKQM